MVIARNFVFPVLALCAVSQALAAEASADGDLVARSGNNEAVRVSINVDSRHVGMRGSVFLAVVPAGMAAAASSGVPNAAKASALGKPVFYDGRRFVPSLATAGTDVVPGSIRFVTGPVNVCEPVGVDMQMGEAVSPRLYEVWVGYGLASSRREAPLDAGEHEKGSSAVMLRAIAQARSSGRHDEADRLAAALEQGRTARAKAQAQKSAVNESSAKSDAYGEMMAANRYWKVADKLCGVE